MIPKIIHYCWLSNDKIPSKLNDYMKTWDIYLPDYEKKHWNFSIFDINQSVWVKEAFENKKYAFAADYIRLYALYHFGGFYLDMDVEVLKSFNPLLKLPIVLCWEKDSNGLEVAAFGVEPKSPIIKICLDRYIDRHFIKQNGELDTEILPLIVKNTLIKNDYKLISVNSIEDALSITNSNEIPVFPPEFFSPKSYKNGQIKKTINTYCIHHFEGSWVSKKNKLKILLQRLLGRKITLLIVRLKSLFKI